MADKKSTWFSELEALVGLGGGLEVKVSVLLERD